MSGTTQITEIKTVVLVHGAFAVKVIPPSHCKIRRRRPRYN
jgi:hypothetical protein